jgi:hypothetical protein
MKFIEDLFKEMHSRRLILTYQGEFTQDITKSVLTMAERNLESRGEQSTVKRKVFNVMVECLQNIVKHSYKGENILDKAIFIIGQVDETYEIATGNFIKEVEIQALSDKIEEVNNLDKAGLKTLYKEIIKDKNGLSERGGAGLGLVDMARKSGHKIEYSFNEYDSEHSFFSLKTRISRSK